MKKVTFLAGLIIALVLTACGKKNTLFGEELLSEVSINNAKQILTNPPFADKQFRWIEIRTNGALNSDFHELEAKYEDPGAGGKLVVQKQDSSSGLGDPSVDNIPEINKNFELFKVSELDFTKVLSQAKGAIEFLSSMQDAKEYENFNVNKISIEKLDGKFVTTYGIDMTKKGEGTQRRGRKRVTNYYTLTIKLVDGGKYEIH